MINKLIHNLRVFFQRRKARKLIAFMDFSTDIDALKSQVPPAFHFMGDHDLPPDHIISKIQNKRKELGLIKHTSSFNETITQEDGSTITYYVGEDGKRSL